MNLKKTNARIKVDLFFSERREIDILIILYKSLILMQSFQPRIFILFNVTYSLNLLLECSHTLCAESMQNW